MRYRNEKKITGFRLDLLGITTLLTAAIGILGLLPSTAYALTTPPSGSLEVGNASSGACAQVSGEVSGSKVNLATCNQQINQKWYVNRAGYYNGQIAYDIETAQAGSFQCLNDATSSVAPAASVNLANCNGVVSAQRFVYINSNGNGNELYNIASGECLDSSSLGAQLVLNPCSVGASSQLWFLVPNNAKV
jgi:hypothetical protein